ncbi:hypothetical protein A3850_000890 [Lewinella sp. 4G2]|nr:hypothetical protein A3850_000890 [Lewinella sp. 4G2]
MSGNMSKEGLTKDLESLAEVGIGGLLLFNVSQGIPVGDVVYNSGEHHEMLAHAAAESERLGLTFGVHNCDGWSSSGGPWVTPEQSMKMLVYSETVISYADTDTVSLSQPTTRENYYEDIAVVAYPSLGSEVEDFTRKPTITASDASYPVELISDGRIDADHRLGEKGATPWLQFYFKKPARIRSAAATFTDRKVTVTLQASWDEGRTWQDQRELQKVRTGKGEWAVNDHFDVIESRYFRMQFSESVRLREASLYRNYLVDNPLGRTAMARTEDAKFNPIGNPAAITKIDPATVVDLTDRMDSNGLLTYNFPPGHWTVLRFGQTSTGAFNNPASWEGRGLEVDKMSRPAFKTHYDAFIRQVVDNSGPVAPNALQYVEIDSYEAGGQNWTTGFDSIFRARKGYDLIPFLPLLAGRFMGADAGAKVRGKQNVAAAVLYDFREVVTNLITENYYEYFTELCHADGLRTYVEPYGFGPLNDLDIGGTCDLPMGEFWMNREMTMVESAVSAAHIYGKPIVSAESFTSRPEINWKGNPAMAKVSGDKAWARGINEFMFHRFAHQANPHVTPGMTMNRWGFHFDRTQTWWTNAGADWFRYIARGSYLLRQGHPVADLMIFVGDGTPNSYFDWDDFDPAIPKWLNYDNVNADVLLNRTGLEDGAITLPEGGRYPLLALKNCDHLSLATLRRLVEIAESGVTVIGEKPTDLAGYGHKEEDYEAFRDLADQLERHLQPARDWEGLMTSRNLQPDLKLTSADSLIYEHRRVGDTEIYFLVNTSKDSVSYALTTRTIGKQPERWDPMTGKISGVARYRHNPTTTDLRLDLDGEESIFLVFRDAPVAGPVISPDQLTEPGIEAFLRNPKNGKIAAKMTANKIYEIELNDGQRVALGAAGIVPVRTLTRPWEVTFREEDGFGSTLPFAELTDWKDHPDERVRYYSGTATYRTTFSLAAEPATAWELDLGEVDNVARIRLNGQDLGVQWMKPFRVDISQALRPGENELVIEVTNLWSNRLIGEERYPKQDGGYRMASYHPKIKMPRWYVDNEPVPPGPRTTFTTADFYDANDPLVPSGLKGPVRIIPYQERIIAPAAAPE